MLLAASTKNTTTLKCNSNTATEYTDKCDQRMKTINRDEKGLCNAWRTELGLRGICHLYQGILFLVEQNLDSVNVSVDSCRDKREIYIFFLYSNTPWTQFTANNTLSADLSVSLLKAESDSNRSHAHRVILKDISHTKVCLWCWQLLNCGDNSNDTHWVCVRNTENFYHSYDGTHNTQSANNLQTVYL